MKIPNQQQINLEKYFDIAFKYTKLRKREIEFVKRFCTDSDRIINKYPLIKK
tara:strand:+ start:888 stop:1043 length:156 start_codon:yes stop_codon:yes gene_type:complete